MSLKSSQSAFKFFFFQHHGLTHFMSSFSLPSIHTHNCLHGIHHLKPWTQRWCCNFLLIHISLHFRSELQNCVTVFVCSRRLDMKDVCSYTFKVTVASIKSIKICILNFLDTLFKFDALHFSLTFYHTVTNHWLRITTWTIIVWVTLFSDDSYVA